MREKVSQINLAIFGNDKWDSGGNSGGRVLA